MASGFCDRQGDVTGLCRLIEQALLPKNMRHDTVGPDRMVDPGTRHDIGALPDRHRQAL
jgi:hypothetical protein